MGANPLAQIVMSALQARTASGGGAPGQTMPGQMPGQGDQQDPAAQYTQQVSELKKADPGMLLRQLNQIKKVLAAMGVENMERLPNVAGQIFKLIPSIDRVIKEASQAQNVNSAVRPPIQMGAANPPQDAAGGM